MKQTGIYAGRSEYIYITALIMGTEMVLEMSVIFNQLTRLIALKYLINVSLRSYMDNNSLLLFHFF